MVKRGEREGRGYSPPGESVKGANGCRVRKSGEKRVSGGTATILVQYPRPLEKKNERKKKEKEGGYLRESTVKKKKRTPHMPVAARVTHSQRKEGLTAGGDPGTGARQHVLGTYLRPGVTTNVPAITVHKNLWGERLARPPCKKKNLVLLESTARQKNGLRSL